MEIIYHIAFGIHLLCVLAILVLLLLQANKNPKKLNPGVVHAALTALVVALVMVGLWDQVHDEEINHTKIGIKSLVVAAILVLGYKNLKKEALKNSIWAVLLGLTTVNILLAYLW
ncbi:MAG: hypothetical protein RL130_512 [Actinomycetota bacterium]